MKKILNFFLALSLVAGVVSCKKDEPAKEINLAERHYTSTATVDVAAGPVMGTLSSKQTATLDFGKAPGKTFEYKDHISFEVPIGPIKVPLDVKIAFSGIYVSLSGTSEVYLKANPESLKIEIDAKGNSEVEILKEKIIGGVKQSLALTKENLANPGVKVTLDSKTQNITLTYPVKAPLTTEFVLKK